MKIVILFCIILISWNIIKNTGLKRFLWLMGGVLFIPSIVGVIASFSAHSIFIISYIVSQFRYKKIKKNIEDYPFKNISLIILIICMLIGLFDDRIPMISKFSRGLIEFITTYLCMFVGYTSINKKDDLEKILNGLVSILFIISIYGLISAVSKSNPIYDMFSIIYTNEVGIWSHVQDRGYRVCSFMDNSIVYGAVMGFFSLFISLYWHPQKKYTKYILLILLLLNVIVANSRTGLVSTALLFALYYLIRYGISFLTIKYIVASIFVCALLYNIPFFQSILNSGIDLVLTGGENTHGGSNMELKEGQLEASLFYFHKAPYFGNGFAYFNEVLGNKDSFYYDPALFGLEGYGYKLLVEDGIFMMIAVTFFFLSLLIFCLKNRSRFPTSSSFVIASTSSFLFFIFATGTYGSVFIFYFLILGLILKYMRSYDVFNIDTRI